MTARAHPVRELAYCPGEVYDAETPGTGAIQVLGKLVISTKPERAERSPVTGRQPEQPSLV